MPHETEGGPEEGRAEELKVEESEGTILVGVHPADMAIIVTGLREMPGAMEKMANAVTVLANNQDQTPSKRYVWMMIALVIVTLVASVVIIDTRSRNGQQQIQVMAERNQRTSERILECLDYGENPEGASSECAQRTARIMTFASMAVADAVQCETEIHFYRIIELNPEVDLQLPPLSSQCQLMRDEASERAGE